MFNSLLGKTMIVIFSILIATTGIFYIRNNILSSKVEQLETSLTQYKTELSNCNKEVVKGNQQTYKLSIENEKIVSRAKNVEEVYSKLRSEYKNELNKLNESANPPKGKYYDKEHSKDINNLFSDF